MYAALLLLEHVVATGSSDILSAVSTTGTSYICKYGSCVDIYYLCTSGKYWNLFLMPGTKKFSDYGNGKSRPGTTSQGYTYQTLSNSGITESMTALLNLLTDD